MKQNLLLISANALRTCFYNVNNDLSFDNIHKNCLKCTPKQIMSYQISLKHFKMLNEHGAGLTTEQVSIFDQLICTSRQLTFKYTEIIPTKLG